LTAILLWVRAVRANKAILVLGLAGVGALYHSWLRRAARKKLHPLSDAEFLAGCRVGPSRSDVALRLRREVAGAFGVPSDRVAPNTRMGDLMNLTGWFGSDLLALGEVQQMVDNESVTHLAVGQDVTVGDVVRHVLAVDDLRTKPDVT
jgi:hypothetical protein